jgi:molybdate transport system ATP-binding protein
MSLRAHLQVALGSLDLDVELHAEPGEVLALLGPNGAGKSTALRCLAGLQQLDGGSISLDGVLLDSPTAATFVEPERRAVAMMFQHHVLFDHLSVLENVAYGLRARGVDKRTARADAANWLRHVQLGEYADTKPRALSGGQAQRVALARALATTPRLLLLDEPLAALDVTTRRDVRRELRRAMSTFDGVRVLVTHDPVDAYALADRVAILEGGRITQAGTLTDVMAHPRTRYVAELVGVNLVVGVVSDGVLTTDAGATVVVADAADGPSFAVIRPQAITVSQQESDGSSVRNRWPATVVDFDRVGDRVRVRLDGPLDLTAEITSAALDALSLRPGDTVFASAKATDIEVYPS